MSVLEHPEPRCSRQVGQGFAKEFDDHLIQGSGRATNGDLHWQLLLTFGCFLENRGESVESGRNRKRDRICRVRVSKCSFYERPIIWIEPEMQI